MDEIKKQDFLTEEQVYDKLEISKIDKFSFVSQRTKKLMTKKDIEDEDSLYYLNCDLEKLKEYGDNDFVKNKDINYACSTLTFELDEGVSGLTVYVEKEERGFNLVDDISLSGASTNVNKPNPTHTFNIMYIDNYNTKSISFPIKKGYYYDYNVTCYPFYQLSTYGLLGNTKMNEDKTIEIKTKQKQLEIKKDTIEVTINPINLRTSTNNMYINYYNDNSYTSTKFTTTETKKFYADVAKPTLYFQIPRLQMLNDGYRLSKIIVSSNDALVDINEGKNFFSKPYNVTYPSNNTTTGNLQTINLCDFTLQIPKTIEKITIDVEFDYIPYQTVSPIL